MIILGHIRVCQSKTKSCSHFRQLSITFFLSRGDPETRSAVLDVAIKQRYFLASLAKWGNLFSFFFQKWRGLPAFEMFGSFLYFDISSRISCFELLPEASSSDEKLLRCASRSLLFLEGGSTTWVLWTRDRASSAIFSQTRSLLVFPQQVTGDTQQSYHNDGCWEKTNNHLLKRLIIC